MRFDLAFARDILPALLEGAKITLLATLGGMAVALVVGLLLALGRLSGSRALSLLCGAYIRFVRGTPLLVQLYFLFYVLPLIGPRFGPMVTGIAGLGLHYGAYLAEVYRAGIEGVPTGQREACVALGLSRVDRWTRILLPQAIPPMIPVIGNYGIGMFKETPLLATITVVELFGAAEHVAGETYRYAEPYTLVALVFLALSYPAALGTRFLEKRLAVRS